MLAERTEFELNDGIRPDRPAKLRDLGYPVRILPALRYGMVSLSLPLHIRARAKSRAGFEWTSLTNHASPDSSMCGMLSLER